MLLFAGSEDENIVHYNNRPLHPWSSVLISRWKISGTDIILNGRRLKQKLPVGVMNVLSFRQLGSNGICQKPLEASEVEKTLAPASLGVISSSVGRI